MFLTFPIQFFPCIQILEREWLGVDKKQDPTGATRVSTEVHTEGAGRTRGEKTQLISDESERASADRDFCGDEKGGWARGCAWPTALECGTSRSTAWARSVVAAESCGELVRGSR